MEKPSKNIIKMMWFYECLSFELHMKKIQIYAIS